jgi:uncharacterized protein (UPF0210 family)
MLTGHEILATLEMLKHEHLDLRTVTLGVSLFDCASEDARAFVERARRRIESIAGTLVGTCDRIGGKYGVPIVNKRIAVSPIALVGAPFTPAQMVAVARALDDSAAAVGVDFIGGFSALVEKGMAAGDRALIEAIPEALASTARVCASINAATTRAGVNMDAVLELGHTVKAAAALSAHADGVGAAKLVVFANMPQDIPFMAGAYLGTGEPDLVINVGVRGPGVVKRAIERAIEAEPGIDLGRLSEVIKQTAFRVTRVGELIGREVAAALNVDFGVVDLSLAPTPNRGDSVGEIFQSLGLSSIGAPGSTALLAMLNDAVKKGGAFASSHVGGLSGAFIPVSEDPNIADAARSGALSLDKLEALTSVCSVGLDMVPLPGATSADTLAAIMADELAIGVINHKTTAARLIPVPGKVAGDAVSFGGLLGYGTVMPVRDAPGPNRFLRFGGRIPAPIHSLVN